MVSEDFLDRGTPVLQQLWYGYAVVAVALAIATTVTGLMAINIGSVLLAGIAVLFIGLNLICAIAAGDIRRECIEREKELSKALHNEND